MLRRFRTLLIVALASVFVGVMGTVIYMDREDSRAREIRRLQDVIARLESESRVAEVVVTRQETDPATDRPRTWFRFSEVDRHGRALSNREFCIDGDVAYFDALVVKFEHSYAELGDALRGRSLYLFRRVFGEHQEPSRGFRLDETTPAGYRLGETVSEFERGIWPRFWSYALDPKLAQSKGIRVAMGEAVYTRLVPGKLYRLTIETAGGLNIKPENLPAVLRDAPPSR
jgi:hypothetical protein